MVVRLPKHLWALPWEALSSQSPCEFAAEKLNTGWDHFCWKGRRVPRCIPMELRISTPSHCSRTWPHHEAAAAPGRAVVPKHSFPATTMPGSCPVLAQQQGCFWELKALVRPEGDWEAPDGQWILLLSQSAENDFQITQEHNKALKRRPICVY